MEGKYAELSEGQSFTNNPVAMKEVSVSYFILPPAVLLRPTANDQRSHVSDQMSCYFYPFLSFGIRVISFVTAALSEGKEEKQQRELLSPE